ncbi:unnamed protein product [Rhodiola kirilowii]
MTFGIRFVAERTVSGQPILDAANGEEFMHIQPGVAIVLRNRTPESPGTLYITTKQVVWLSDVMDQKAMLLIFCRFHFTLCPGIPSLPFALYLHSGANEDDSEGSDLDSDEPHDLSSITEMRLVPSDPNQLDNLFEIFCECAELNPEPVEGMEEEEHNWIFSADQLEGEIVEVDDSEWPVLEIPENPIGYSNGNHDLANSVLELQINDHRFDDAEEMDSDNKRDEDRARREA